MFLSPKVHTIIETQDSAVLPYSMQQCTRLGTPESHNLRPANVPHYKPWRTGSPHTSVLCHIHRVTSHQSCVLPREDRKGELQPNFTRGGGEGNTGRAQLGLGSGVDAAHKLEPVVKTS